MDKLTEQFGALGNWEKIDETFDKAIVKQQNDASCVAAVGEMLAKHYGLKIAQAEILEAIGIWSNAEGLAKFLNSKETQIGVKRIGGYWDNPIGALKLITRKDKVWGVMLREGSPLGHAVLIYGEDENGLILIKDPFDQTSYKMTSENLQKVLSEFVWRRKVK